MRLIPCAALAATLGVTAFLGLAMPPAAEAHSWYSIMCCNDRDCAPLPAGAVQATNAGWRLIETGEVVPYGDGKERDSKDSQFHICRPGAKGKNGLAPIRCLYVPSFGS